MVNSLKPGSLTGTSKKSISIQIKLKRIIDVFASSLSLIFLSPFFLLTCILIKLETKGPAIYRHLRVGKDGVPFILFKFRTMVTENDSKEYLDYLQKLIDSERSEGRRALPYRKMRSDPRVTRMGRFLRRYYLDELLQLWNVLKGDMSLVGPRPHVQLEVEHYSADQRRRLSVKPGITGYWQIAGREDCTFNELIAMDLDYIDHWTLRQDVSFIIKTFLAMARGGELSLQRLGKRTHSANAELDAEEYREAKPAYPETMD